MSLPAPELYDQDLVLAVLARRRGPDGSVMPTRIVHIAELSGLNLTRALTAVVRLRARGVLTCGNVPSPGIYDNCSLSSDATAREAGGEAPRRADVLGEPAGREGPATAAGTEDRRETRARS